MSTVRTKKNKNYTTISNVVLNDVALSWKAKGLAAYLLSKPDEWKIQREHLAKQSEDGISAVRSALQELEKFGYLVRQKTRTEKGIIEWEYVLHEEPQNREPLREKGGVRKKKGAKPVDENQPMEPSADNPPVENPPVENPPVENPPVENRTLVNTDVVNTDVVNTDVPMTEKPSERANPVARADPPTPPPTATPTAPTPATKTPRLPNDSTDMPDSSPPPPPPLPATPPPPERTLIDGRKWRKGGSFIQAGKGETPVEIYYEAFSINDKDTRLTEPDEDDLARCGDLAKFREVIDTYRRCNFKIKRNIQLILEWYRDGIPERYKRKEQPNEHHTATQAPEPAGRYAKLKAGKTGV